MNNCKQFKILYSHTGYSIDDTDVQCIATGLFSSIGLNLEQRF